MGVHSQYCKARVPCGRLSTLAPWHSAHAWMRWCLRVAPHASGESTLMWLNTEPSRIYAHTKLHWWGVNAETCMYADGITLLHLGVVEHSVRRASGCSFAILQSPRPLWSFEHSGPMTLCACVDALVSPCCTACVWWEHSHVVKYGAITYLRTYKAALIIIIIII